MQNKDNEIEMNGPLLVILITLAGGFLRIFLLGHQGLWLDEAFSVWMARHNVADLLSWTIKIDQHPPLYYLLLHSWINLTWSSPYFARMLSVLFGVATIPVIYLIGKRISGALMGVAAAIFLSLSLFNIYYAQEARMYTLLTFNAALAIYFLVRLLTDPCSLKPIGSQFREYVHAWRTLGPAEPDPKENFRYREDPRDLKGWKAWVYNHRWLPIQAIETDLTWIAFIIFSAATLLTHNTAVFFILAINIYVVGLMLYQRLAKSRPQPAFQAPSLGNWAKAHLGILLLWSPWLPAFIRQSVRVDQEFWIPKPTWDMVIQTLRALLNPSGHTQYYQVMTWALCAMLVLALVFFRKRLSIFFFLAALFAIPVLGELIVSIRRPIFFDRTLIWITIPLFLALAAGVTQLKFPGVVFLVLGIFGTSFVFSTGDYYRYMEKEDWDDPAGYISLRMGKDDVIIFNSAMTQIAFDYYFEDYASKKYFEVEEHGVPDMLETGHPESIMTDSEIPRLVSLLNGHDRVWLVYSHNSYTDPHGLVPQTLAGQRKLIETHDFYGGQVQLYGSP